MVLREMKEERLDFAVLKDGNKLKLDGDGYTYGRVKITNEELLWELKDSELKGRLQEFGVETKQVKSGCFACAQLRYTIQMPRRKQLKKDLLEKLMDEEALQCERDALDRVLCDELDYYYDQTATNRPPGSLCRGEMFRELEKMVCFNSS